MLNFINKKAEKSFKKLDSNIKKLILKKLNSGIDFLSEPNKKLRGQINNYRIKCKKFRIFYAIHNSEIVVFKIGQKDKNPYKEINIIKGTQDGK